MTVSIPKPNLSEPLILVTNDDGVEAPGIVALHRAVADLGQVVRVAPVHEQSAKSHALSIRQPLRIDRRAPDVVGVEGTPADCVLIAVRRLLGRHPDVVVSGVNDGPNLGDDVNYSGTVAAAMEGSLLGVPGVAVSLGRQAGRSFETAASVARAVVERVLCHQAARPPELDLPAHAGAAPVGRRSRDRVVLNINVPGIAKPGRPRLTRLGKRVYKDAIVEKQDPYGADYYWVAGEPAWIPEDEAGVPTDFEVVSAGDVSITPLKLDATDYAALDTLAAWNLGALPEVGARE